MDTRSVGGEIVLMELLEGESRMSPQELVCRAYEQERDLVYRYLVSLGTDRAGAQELTQEVFLKLYVSLRSGKQIESVHAWVFKVASNLALNQQRADIYHPSANTDDIYRLLEAQVDPGTSPEELLLEKERAVAIREIFASLSQQQQVCLHLRAEGFRYKEIAAIVGISVPTVGEFIRRAITRIRKVIHD